VIEVRRVIWPEKYDPETSAIHALNDIDVKAPRNIYPSGAAYSWEFSRAGNIIAFEATGPLSLDDQDPMVEAASPAQPSPMSEQTAPAPPRPSRER